MRAHTARFILFSKKKLDYMADASPITPPSTHDVSADETGVPCRYGRPGQFPAAVEGTLDRLAGLAAHLVDVPVGLVTFIGEEWQWHRGAAGTPIKKVEREHAICTHAIETEGPMVVEDLQSDPRFEENPYVGSFGSGEEEGKTEVGTPRSAEFRLYAGAPLVTPSGDRIGTVCVLDTVPRHISRRKVRCLEHLSDLAMESIDGQL